MRPQNYVEMHETFLSEELFFGLLGKILYKDPDQAWYKTLLDEDVFSEVPFGGSQPDTVKGLKKIQEWKEKNHGLTEKSFEAIKSDHLYLFIGVGKVLAPVWESVYFNPARLIFQEETFKVRNWYGRYKLQVKNKNKEPDDHIGLEFLFIAHLAKQGLEALEKKEHAEAEALFQAQKDFLSEHLLKWGAVWCDLVDEHAKTDFYRGISLIVRGSLAELSSIYELNVPVITAKWE
jgi:putative dimethyl sulfoxide reductase chaperone